MPEARYRDLTLYRRLLGQAKPFWPHIGGVFLLNLLATPVALLTPLPLKIAVDSAIGHHPLVEFLAVFLPASVAHSRGAALVIAVALLMAVTLLNQVQRLAADFFSTYTGQRMVLEFRARLFHHVQRLSLAYHDVKGTADSNYRIQWDALSIQYIMIDGVIPFISAGFTVVGMIYITARLDWELALVALAVSPVLILVARVYRRYLRRQSRAVKQLESSALSVVQEALSALRVVKAFSREEREQERFIGRAYLTLWAQVRLALAQGGFGLVVGMILAAGASLVLYIGARHVESGALTLGELLVIMGYLSQLYVPLETIGKKAGSMQTHLASAERAFTMLDEPSDVAEDPHALPLERAAGAVTLDHVSFRYDTDRPILHDVSLIVPPGTRVGIAGTTGAGKTTLVSLLTRFYDPDEGKILLDGVDLRKYKLADLRNQFGIVLQEPVLFSTSIAENIRYARPDASLEEVVDAARAANADSFIRDLPDGYDTMVGERGMRLSGGERQRISLARAFLKDAPILILDEPTSSVDIKTEAVIMEAMERLMNGRTTFMIAHRLTTLDNCDVRLVVERGRIVASTGAWESTVTELVKSGGCVPTTSTALPSRNGEAR